MLIYAQPGVLTARQKSETYNIHQIEVAFVGFRREFYIVIQAEPGRLYI